MFKSLIQLMRWFASDLLRKQGPLPIAICCFFAYKVLRVVSYKWALSIFLFATRSYPNRYFFKVVKNELQLGMGFMTKYLDCQVDKEEADWCLRTIVLKNPIFHEAGVEKGIFLVKFTTTFPYVLRNTNIKELSEYFHIVLEPSWAGYALPEILAWAALGVPVIVESSEKTDFELLKVIGTNLHPVRFGSSDWVDFRCFTKLPNVGKIYDAIYVANYHPIKRHHVLFKAISKIKDDGYRACLVCNSWGDANNVIRELIKFYGIEDKITMFDRMSQGELNKLLNKSKVNVLMSLKEGSNRSVFEGFFADIPGIVLKNNIGVNKAYFNEYTGMLVCEKDLPEALIHFRDHWANYKPREWAMENISPIRTTEKLKALITTLNYNVGIETTGEIAVKINKPEADYFHVDDRNNLLDRKAVCDLFKSKNKSKMFYFEGVRSLLERGSTK